MHGALKHEVITSSRKPEPVHSLTGQRITTPQGQKQESSREAIIHLRSLRP